MGASLNVDRVLHGKLLCSQDHSQIDVFYDRKRDTAVVQSSSKVLPWLKHPDEASCTYDKSSKVCQNVLFHVPMTTKEHESSLHTLLCDRRLCPQGYARVHGKVTHPCMCANHACDQHNVFSFDKPTNVCFVYVVGLTPVYIMHNPFPWTKCK